ncbi:MAG: 4'-phosphopantetheinyl transferase superfamily protein [candidate division WOR-3 bacterium]|nr:MAG: 4'-phosphopantetheinyl transferase superfamily protein [candidate division WOR-3 bacterium]
MIKGIGIDIVDRIRFENVSDRPRIFKELFTEKELQEGYAFHDPSHWAGCFALKEAVMKAFCVGLHMGSYWHDIEILHDGITVSGIFNPCRDRKATVRASQTRSRQYALGLVLLQE